MIPKKMDEEIIHAVDELLLKFDTVEELEELAEYIESEIALREYAEEEDDEKADT